MHFTQLAATAAGLFSLSQAHVLGDVTGSLGLDHIETGFDKTLNLNLAPVSFGLTKGLQNEILYDGVCQAKTDTSAAVHLGLNIEKLAVTGEVDLSIKDEFLVHPIVKLSLADIKAYVELDLDAEAAVHESLELVASPKLDLSLGKLLEAHLGVGFALDLVVAVDAAIKVTAGFYVEFGAEAYVEVNLLSKAIVDVNLDGLIATAQEISVCESIDLTSAIELNIGLRLRTQIGVEAGLDLPCLPVKAGLAAAADIWLDLFDYTAVIISTSGCTISAKENFAVRVGVEVDVEVEALDIVDINLAPKAMVQIAAGPINAEVCLHTRGECGSFLHCNGKPTHSTSYPAITASTTGPVGTPVPTGDMVTSTTSVTKTYTITSCAASVHNCPASMTQKVITSTVYQETTVCPATMTGAPVTSTATGPVTIPTITRTKTVVVPCKQTTTHYTAPPSSTSCAPTVIVVSDTTTECPSTTAPAGSGSGSMTVPATTAVVTTSAPAMGTPPAGGNGSTCPGGPNCPPAGGNSTPVSPPVTTSPPSGGNTCPGGANCPPTGGNGSTPPAGGNGSTCPGGVNCPPAGGASSMVSVPAGGVPTPTVMPTPTSTPITAGASNIKVGLALALPAFFAMLM